MNPTRIDPTGVRMSTNLSIGRQTQKADFGDRINAGLSVAGGAITNGLAAAAPALPGGAILSAAVSSLGAGGGGGGSALGGQYASGITAVGGGGLSTTIGATGGIGGLGGGGVGVQGMPSGVGTNAAAGMTGSMNGGLAETQQSLGEMLQVQMQIQRENQVFTTVSNVLKTRHDTVKNTIQNVH